MVSSTGRLATWWTSSDVVLVPEDVTQWVSLEQRACSERQQANQEEMLHCCLEGGSFKANVEMEEMEGYRKREEPCQESCIAMLASFQNRARFLAFLFILFTLLFFLPLLFPFLNLVDQHAVDYKIPNSTVTCRKRHAIMCLKIFFCGMYVL